MTYGVAIQVVVRWLGDVGDRWFQVKACHYLQARGDCAIHWLITASKDQG